MKIFFEPVNVNQWNMFEKVTGEGHIEPFLATKSMEEGDLVVLHVGSQNKQYDSGIYAYGTIVKGPYILENSPEDYCNNKNTGDVKIDYICYGTPLITHEEAKDFINQFRTVHIIDEEHYNDITKLGKNENVNTEIIAKICVALKCDVSDIMEIIPDNEKI